MIFVMKLVLLVSLSKKYVLFIEFVVWIIIVFVMLYNFNVGVSNLGKWFL